jgi:proton glutamate symport protein
MTAAVGGIVGEVSGQVDLEFVMDATQAVKSSVVTVTSSGIANLVPSNIFAALSSNEITSVLVFTAIFGLGMAVSERRTGNSLFPQLMHLHDACLLIFEWLNICVPIGIVALIAPQISQLGVDVFLILAHFTLVTIVACFLLIGMSVVLMAWTLGISVSRTFSVMLKPLSLVAATRNATACVPIAIEAMTDELHASRAGCELFIPLGFTIFRFGYILHFAAAVIFIGALVGRGFSLPDMLMVGALSTIASFGTIGLGGSAGLASLAAVLRPFGLSFELALPILLVVDPIIGMARAMLSVALVCMITSLAAGRQLAEDLLLAPTEVPAG